MWCATGVVVKFYPINFLIIVLENAFTWAQLFPMIKKKRREKPLHTTFMLN